MNLWQTPPETYELEPQQRGRIWPYLLTHTWGGLRGQAPQHDPDLCRFCHEQGQTDTTRTFPFSWLNNYKSYAYTRYAVLTDLHLPSPPRVRQLRKTGLIPLFDAVTLLDPQTPGFTAIPHNIEKEWQRTVEICKPLDVCFLEALQSQSMNLPWSIVQHAKPQCTKFFILTDQIPPWSLPYTYQYNGSFTTKQTASCLSGRRNHVYWIQTIAERDQVYELLMQTRFRCSIQQLVQQLRAVCYSNHTYEPATTYFLYA